VREGLIALGAGRGGASEEKPKRRRLNLEQRRALGTACVALFARAWGRKAQKGCEPNDRHYSIAFQRKLRRMRPEDLDRLLRDDED